MSEYTTDQILDMIEALGDPSKLDLSGKDLMGIDLSRETIWKKLNSCDWPENYGEPMWFSLRVGANLCGANLQRANLQGADLNGADLERANLKGAHLQGADLLVAVLQEANLQEAFLMEANLQKADLTGANLQKANLCVADLQGAKLNEANLQNVDLVGANLRGAELNEANLQKADLRWVKLQGAYLRGTNLHEVDTSEAQSLEGAYFDGARLHLTRLQAEKIEQVGEEKDRDYHAAQRAYLALKVNFKEIGYYDDAHWAYLKERRMERKTFFPTKKGEDWTWARLKHLPLSKWERLFRKFYTFGFWAHLFFKPPPHTELRRRAWLWSWAQDFFTEYMESWQRIVWRLILPTPLIFALFYWWTKGVTNILPGAPPVSPMDYLFFSLRTMVTLAYSDFTPVGAGQWLAPMKGAMGIAFFALLAFSVAKRIARD